MTSEDVSPLREAAAYLKWLRANGPIDLQAQPRAASQLSDHKPVAVVATPTNSPTAVTSPDGLENLRKSIADCAKCKLGKTRTQTVFGVGSSNADLMFIGEAPGEMEDKTGEPFVGRAGKLLTQELQKNGIERAEVFIANVIKCRPPENRDPEPEEIAACEPFLHDQIAMIRPKMLCALGRYAASCLLKETISIMKIRGTWRSYQGLPLFICVHPSAALRAPSTRQLFDADIAALAAIYHNARKTGAVLIPGPERM